METPRPRGVGRSAMSKVLVPLADGCEEMEAVILIDTLRRAQIEVVVAGLKPGPVTASRGVKLAPDTTLDAVRNEDFDAIALPGGGGGTENLMKDERVLDAVRDFHGRGKLVAAICAAPQVLQKAGVIDGKRITCYPGVAAHITRATRVDERVVQDGRVITSQGPGTSFHFALALVQELAGRAKAEEVAGAMLVSI
jgi:4-methyl-5(b-hydroxyethyl)-thiazole monophosphate biosynthesis